MRMGIYDLRFMIDDLAFQRVTLFENHKSSI